VNKLSKTQRDQLLGIVIGTIGLMAALWYLGVNAKQEQLSKTERKTAEVRDTLKRADDKIRRAQEVADQLQAHQAVLDRREAILAPDRDAYAWVINTINPFILPRKGVNISHYSQPEVSESGIIPAFPYKWATFHLEGTGFYYEFGRFFADLENDFPFYRVQNLAISANVGAGTDPDRLNFTFDLVVPVKPSETK
jgi:Tfp pilus assembly protein PilO